MKMDKAGNSYALLSALKEGSTLKADGGFNCLEEGEICVVNTKDGYLAIRCIEGWHDLTCQDDGDGSLIGLYHVRV